MNEDQFKGKAKNIGGKIQEEVGDLIDSKSQEAKGIAKQVEGKAQEKVGDLKEIAKDRGNC
ncbi:CsbD family protein [Massilia glaciei]|uniref:CsbD family protein n=1 Tax=Massilia glaciei TaxID=1524097 RepID=A0A2U2HED7_9BURK|nr:CsbD family protein [Massilia glaciei]PWF41887.1 CsbD family protein [Massilia glaciei]